MFDGVKPPRFQRPTTDDVPNEFDEVLVVVVPTAAGWHTTARAPSMGSVDDEFGWNPMPSHRPTVSGPSVNPTVMVLMNVCSRACVWVSGRVGEWVSGGVGEWGSA
jgi:hypothetical protein